MRYNNEFSPRDSRFGMQLISTGICIRLHSIHDINLVNVVLHILFNTHYEPLILITSKIHAKLEVNNDRIIYAKEDTMIIYVYIFTFCEKGVQMENTKLSFINFTGVSIKVKQKET